MTDTVPYLLIGIMVVCAIGVIVGMAYLAYLLAKDHEEHEEWMREWNEDTRRIEQARAARLRK